MLSVVNLYSIYVYHIITLLFSCFVYVSNDHCHRVTTQLQLIKYYYNLLESSGPVKTCNGIAFYLHFTHRCILVVISNMSTDARCEHKIGRHVFVLMLVVNISSVDMVITNSCRLFRPKQNVFSNSIAPILC
jgi:hypothetical protein